MKAEKANRFVVIGYLAKGAGMEFSSLHGYVIKDGESLPSHSEIRNDCLNWANRDGGDFSYFQINFIQYLREDDYLSLMGLDG